MNNSNKIYIYIYIYNPFSGSYIYIYIHIIDQARGQDGWILAEFSFWGEGGLLEVVL